MQNEALIRLYNVNFNFIYSAHLQPTIITISTLGKFTGEYACVCAWVNDDSNCLGTHFELPDWLVRHHIL